MEKTENKLIKNWRFGASLIILNTINKNPTEQVQELARTQLKMLNNEMQNRNISLNELPKEHQEFMDYIQKVVETGEF